jgi:lipoyl-dependent peroxiredoxin
MQRKGSAVWQGDLKTGKGTVSTESGVLSQMQYSFSTRFESGKGTNPEELIAAAHAACFTMALSAQLGSAGLTPEKLETSATVTFDKLETGWTVTNILLDVRGKVPKADQAAWDKATQAAKTGCPISRLFNTTINMQAKLEG